MKDLEDPFDFAGFDDILVQFRLERNALAKATQEFVKKYVVLQDRQTQGMQIEQ